MFIMRSVCTQLAKKRSFLAVNEHFIYHLWFFLRAPLALYVFTWASFEYGFNGAIATLGLFKGSLSERRCRALDAMNPVPDGTVAPKLAWKQAWTIA